MRRVLTLTAIGALTLVSAADRNAPAVVSGATAAIAPKMACADLSKTNLSAAVGAGVKITHAEETEPQGGGRYCVVQGVINPEIRFEVRLPTAAWTGRFVQTGCGGLCGNLDIRTDHAEGCAPVMQHQVVLASTDMGHSGGGAQWAERNPATRADFGYRGVHLTAVASRALITAYYGQRPRYSYFSGCSDGGREAFIEAQRYPEDFDGIAAGAPAYNFTVQNSFYHAWNALSNTDAAGQPILTAAQLPLLHAAVLSACDRIDGASDGVIDDPRQCHFDPAVLQCKAGDPAAKCLSAAQVETARKLYDGARTADGKKLVMGGPMPGSELSWVGVFVPEKPGGRVMSPSAAYDAVRFLGYEKPLPASWTLRDFKFTEETLQSFKLRGLYDATDPDLSAFKNRGGKLLIWHGWSDPHISPINSIGYYEELARRMGATSVPSFARLFLIPGLYHCFGGEGLTQFDVLGALMDWVEQGKAPEELVLAAAQNTGANPATRPIYPYPDISRRTDRAGQAPAYQRVKGVLSSKPVDWAGSGFFEPGYEINCDSGLPSQCAAPTGMR